MEIRKYLSSMLPMFTRQRILEDIDMINASLVENTLPVFEEYTKIMGKGTFKSDFAKEYQERFDKRFDGKDKGNIIGTINEQLKNIAEKMPVLTRLVENYYADDVTRNAMTILRVNILQYLDAISFSVQYARRLLIGIVSFEVNTINSNIDVELLEGETAWIDDNFPTFVTCLNILDTDKDPEALEKKMSAIPDMSVNPDSVDTVTAVVGRDKVDPFQMGFIPVMLNPAYHIGMRIAEWQANRYQKSVEEREMLQFRLLQFNLVEKGRNDAALERKVKTTQDRIDKLNYKISKMEENYGTS